jgi:hypothetical protein
MSKMSKHNKAIMLTDVTSASSHEYALFETVNIGSYRIWRQRTLSGVKEIFSDIREIVGSKVTAY